MLVSALVLHALLDQTGCTADGAQPIAKVAPQLKQLGPLAALTKGALARKLGAELVVDEQVQTIQIVLPAANKVVLPLALPDPWSGSLELALEGAAPICIEAHVVASGDELTRAELSFSAATTTHLKRKGGTDGSSTFTVTKLIAYRQRVLTTDSNGVERTWWIGKGMPRVDLLQLEADVPFPVRAADKAGDTEVESSGSGPRAYIRSLQALDPKLVEDLNSAGDKDGRAIAFVAIADELRATLRRTVPSERLAISDRIVVDALPKTLRPLATYWKDALSPSPGPGDRMARFLIDESAKEVWVDGVRVFERSATSSSSVEVPIRKTAARVWVVFDEHGKARVFDTTAVMLPGSIYNVGEGLFSSVAGGVRRECIRVTGALPDGEQLRWRELGTPPGPLMDVNESFHPSGAQDRREVGVVDKDLFAARVPPLPLVYSYTHAGTYEWTVSPKGIVSLRLLPDMKLCSATGNSAAP